MLGIAADRVENVLWRAQDLFLTSATSFVIIHCNTDNADQNQPKYIVVGIIKTTKTFTKKHSKVNTIITTMLPMDKTDSFQQTTINETNMKLKAKCQSLPQTCFMNRDNYWVKNNTILNENF